ncbi:ABC transporter ATP-binding protein [Aquamicrobium segne]|uniref:ABC transporter ATP-binding protein n=1 Tax=Aquamicrobium segne TaxID=469547 RepID=A0ABW0H0K9_9HYPH
MSVLAARDLVIGYGSTMIADRLAFDLSAGTVTCLLGPNGVGKTTLFKTLLGLLPKLAGSIRVGDAELASLSRPMLARHLAYVPQSYSADFAYTVLDLVVMGRTAHLGIFSTPTQPDVNIALEMLDRLGIAALAHHDARQLSGGQRQLVLIARALAQQAKIIVMDEPTASLDLANRIQVLRKVRALADDGLSILLSTHEPEQAFAIADQVLALGPDKQLETGPVDEVLTPERLSHLYGVALTVEKTPSGRHVVTAE